VSAVLDDVGGFMSNAFASPEVHRGAVMRSDIRREAPVPTFRGLYLPIATAFALVLSLVVAMVFVLS
jgi:hypothetical protein